MLSKHPVHSKWKNQDFIGLSRHKKCSTRFIDERLCHPTKNPTRKSNTTSETHRHQIQTSRLALGLESFMRLSREKGRGDVHTCFPEVLGCYFERVLHLGDALIFHTDHMDRTAHPLSQPASGPKCCIGPI